MLTKILVLNFFPAFIPPQSGGELRYYNMYLNLSKFYDITLLSPTYRQHNFEILEHSKTFREYRVPKEEIHDRLHCELDKENFCSEVSALVCCLASKTKNKFHEIYEELYSKSDIIIHEFPYMLDYDVYFGFDNKLRIYNSHNFESDLVEQMWKGANASKYIEMIREREAKLVQKCDIVFATSQKEQTAFVKKFNVAVEKIFLAPNGIDVELYKELRKENKGINRKKAFFIGSAHPPNIEAAEFIINNLADKCKNVTFYIAGKCCDKLYNDKSNVILMGLVDERQKNEIFETSDIALNPMFSGAGTNLKTLEFMSAGIPVISTDIGVRGLGLIPEEHFILAKKETFAERLNDFIEDVDLLNEIAEKGKNFINDNYSWGRICTNVYKVIKQKEQSKKIDKKTLFVVNDYEIDNPVSGGSVRIYNLLKYLSHSYKVFYLCLNNSQEIRKKSINENFLHLSIPKTKNQILEEQRINGMHWISANDIIAGYMLEENDYFLSIVTNSYSISELVILEHPYLINAFKNLDGKKMIYESHNFEYELKKKLLCEHPIKNRLLEKVKEFEQNSILKSDIVISVSNQEVDKLKDFSSRKNVVIEVIQNGVNIVEPNYDYDKLSKFLGNKPIAIFIGSGHGPNVEAANFIVWELARQLPEIVFALVGTVCDSFNKYDLPQNVLVFGKLSEKYKNFLLFSSTVALNPIKEGAGSNLKLAEYFAFKLPSISTEFGARGYNVQNENHLIICKRELFADNINKVILKKDTCEELGKNAYELAKKELSWEVLGEKYKKVIDKSISKKRLLVVTYRYNKSNLGGAEVYLSNILTRIANRGNFNVDVVTTNIEEIKNQFHFTCSYGIDEEINVEETNGFKCKKFAVDKYEDKEKWIRCKKLYENFVEEGFLIAEGFIELYNKPLLMGGWHYPEKNKSDISIWNTGKSQIYIQGIIELELKGYSPRKSNVQIIIDGRYIEQYNVKGTFNINLKNVNGKVMTILSEIFFVENNDVRPLSLNFNSINYKIDNEWANLSFESDYKKLLTNEYLDEYVEAMITTAEKRSSEYNEEFYKLRGPISNGLETWLDKNVKNYDIVLGHSVPFSTSILANKYAQKYQIPIVQLPHFHMEDNFYHWSNYYKMLREANLVLTFPKAAIDTFYNKIGAKSYFVAGGGILKEEFETIDCSSFKQVYLDNNPFVLVLGRKAGSKNYQWVIEAIEKINHTGEKLNLLIIGRDEDGEKVDSPFVKYLGEQPRSVVLGALKSCKFVVNMSGSESFGIVILEAWMVSKPIIVNENCAAFTELVEDGINGLYANRENLSDKIISLLNSKELVKMGQTGYIKARNEYTWDSISENIEKIFSENLNL